jgi:hypothetical protein
MNSKGDNPRSLREERLSVMTPELRKFLDDVKAGTAKITPNLEGGVAYFGNLPRTFSHTGSSTLTIKRCLHPDMPKVDFDPVAARLMPSHEVRQKWPRKYLKCPDCNEGILSYASFEHYVAGDW